MLKIVDVDSANKDRACKKSAPPVPKKQIEESHTATSVQVSAAHPKPVM
jgi:hypothetical protein